MKSAFLMATLFFCNYVVAEPLSHLAPYVGKLYKIDGHEALEYSCTQSETEEYPNKKITCEFKSLSIKKKLLPKDIEAKKQEWVNMKKLSKQEFEVACKDGRKEGEKFKKNIDKGMLKHYPKEDVEYMKNIMSLMTDYFCDPNDSKRDYLSKIEMDRDLNTCEIKSTTFKKEFYPADNDKVWLADSKRNAVTSYCGIVDSSRFKINPKDDHWWDFYYEEEIVSEGCSNLYKSVNAIYTWDGTRDATLDCKVISWAR